MAPAAEPPTFMPRPRGPKRAVPTRTSVAPSSTATAKSWLMPIESSGSGRPKRSASRSRTRAARRKCGRDFSGSASKGGTAIRPRHVEMRAAEDGARQALPPRPAVDARLGLLAAHVDLEQDRQGSADSAGGAPRGEPQVFPGLAFPRLRTIVAPSSPCSTAKGRSGAIQVRETRPRSASILAAALLNAVLAEAGDARPAPRWRRFRRECVLVTAMRATRRGVAGPARRGLARSGEDVGAAARDVLGRNGAHGSRSEGSCRRAARSLASAPRLASRSAFLLSSRGTWAIAKRRKLFARCSASA